MKILTIENAIKLELDDLLSRELWALANKDKTLRMTEEGFTIIDGSIKDKALTIYKIILLATTNITESFGSTPDEVHNYFQHSILPRLMNTQVLISKLYEEGHNPEPYLHLIDTLKDILLFEQRIQPAVVQYTPC